VIYDRIHDNIIADLWTLWNCGYVGYSILKYSREYRSVIKACIVDIKRHLEPGICEFCFFSHCLQCAIRHMTAGTETSICL